MAPVSRLSSERHKATACSLLMLHFSWNNHTVFQTPKGMPKLDNTSLPPPQLSPHATPRPPAAPSLHPTPLCSPANQPTRHPLLPCTHPLVSCPYLGRVVWALSSGLGRGRGRALSWHKGGRRRSSEHSQLFLNKDMSGIQAPLPAEEPVFSQSSSRAHSREHSWLRPGHRIRALRPPIHACCSVWLPVADGLLFSLP